MSEFLDFLKNEKHKADNTLIAYDRDIKGFENFLKQRDKTVFDCVESDAISYVISLGNDNKSKATVNRKISALRTYYEYLIRKGSMTENPFLDVKAIRNDKRVIDYLEVEEVEALLDLPWDDKKGVRDKALMEFMYGTGARVTEVVRLKREDINLKMGFVTLKDVNDESRIVPLGQYAKDALTEYFNDAYPEFKGGQAENTDYAFVNFRGEQLTRQGIWKILKGYGKQLGIGNRMTPQILRDSFAVHIIANGGDLKTLKELMGFEDLSVGIAYLAVTEIHVRDVFKRCHPRA